MTTTYETWMPEARQIAAQCYCDNETKNIVMDTILVEAVAKRIAVWMNTAAQTQRNCDYYKSKLKLEQERDSLCKQLESKNLELNAEKERVKLAIEMRDEAIKEMTKISVKFLTHKHNKKANRRELNKP